MIRASLKSLLGRKVRLLLSTFAIVLGVAFVVGTLVFSDTLNKSFTTLFDGVVGDVVVQPAGGVDGPGGSGSSTRAVRGDLVDRLAALPGAARADGQIASEEVYVIGSNGKAVGGFGPPSFGTNWSDAPAGNGLTGLAIVDGREPQGPGEVVLDERTAERAGYAVGDTVPIITSDAVANLEPTLVGIAGFPDGGSLNGATNAAFETAYAQELFHGGRDEFDSIWVTRKDGVTQDELQAQVAPLLADDLEAVTGDDEARDQADQLLDAISFLTIFLMIFAGISLVVGTYIIVNTFSILVAQRSRELALLRALGASTKQVQRSVQLEALVVGLLGATVGIGLGALLAIGLRALFATFGLDLSGQSLVYSPRTFLAAYGVGVLVTMVAAYLPARRTSRIAPVQAMRDDIALPEDSLRRRFLLGLVLAVLGAASLAIGLTDLVDFGGGWFTGAGILAILLGVTAMSPVISAPLLRGAQAAYAGAFGAIGNLAGQNSLRNPRRTTATASALMIGLTLACAMSIIGSSAKATVDQQTEDGFAGDFVVTSVFRGSFSSSIAERVADVDGVADVVRQRLGFADRDGFTGVIGTDPSAFARFGITITEGSADALRRGTVAVSEGVADDDGLAIGDDYTIEVPAGEVTWKVAAVFESSPLLSQGAVVDVATFEDAGYKARDNQLVVFADDGVTPSVLQSRLDEALLDQPTLIAQDQEAFAADQREQIDQFVLIIYALLGLALIIAVLGIVNTLALSVIERTREVGLLRAIGVTRPQLRRMITLESVVIALLGAVLGVVLGTGFGVALMYAVRDEGLDVIDVPVDQLALFLVLGVVIGVVAAILPARRAARLDVLTAIATD